MAKSFFDDYEEDCIEIWDDIEELQKEMRRVKAQLKVLLDANGVKAKVEA